MMIQVENLVKRYGDVVALDHFNLQIAEGEIFGLLGPNGSGKTTAINCMLSLLKYDRGAIKLFGRPMGPDAYDLNREIGVVMQNVAVFYELTVYENINYFCSLYLDDKRQRQRLVEEAIEFVGLEDYRRFLPKRLSGGLLRRLNIACGIAHKPKLIFLDEPTVAVDPQSRNSILEGINIHILVSGNGHSIVILPAVHDFLITGTVDVTLIINRFLACLIDHSLLLRCQSIINLLVDAEEQTIIICVP